MTSPPTLAGFDPLSREFLTDPFPTWAQAQKECPVFFYPAMNYWVLTRLDDVLEAVTDWQTFSSRAVALIPPPPDLACRVPSGFFRSAFVSIDPPEHTVPRKAANAGFTRSRIAALEPEIAAIANRLIDRVEAAGACDLMQDYCYQLSLRTIVHVLGLDDSDQSLSSYRQWTEDVFALMTPVVKDETGARSSVERPMDDRERHERWSRIAEAADYYRTVIAQRRADPGGDLVSVLVDSRNEHGQPALDDDKIITHIQELIAAGNDTTANLMGSLVLYLSEQPEDFAELKRSPALLENAVEEGMRRRGSSIGMFRVTTRDVQVSGVDIPAGSMVFLSWQAAGHDTSHFPNPRHVDLRRKNAGEHVSLGRGRHFCMGAPLARTEARIGLQTLFERIPGLEVVPEQSLEFSPTLNVSMLRSLDVRWQR
jgi:cytochrome P450